MICLLILAERELLSQLTIINEKLKEVEDGLALIKQLISEGVESRRSLVLSNRFGGYEYEAVVAANPALADDEGEIITAFFHSDSMRFACLLTNTQHIQNSIDSRFHITIRILKIPIIQVVLSLGVDGNDEFADSPHG